MQFFRTDILMANSAPLQYTFEQVINDVNHHYYIDVFVQDCSNSGVLAMEWMPSYTNPLIWSM